jgi:hypothetical protein
LDAKYLRDSALRCDAILLALTTLVTRSNRTICSMSAGGHSRRFGVDGKSAYAQKPDILGARYIRREVPGSDICTAATSILFDDLVRSSKQRRRHLDAKHSSSPHIDDQLKPCGLHYR